MHNSFQSILEHSLSVILYSDTAALHRVLEGARQRRRLVAHPHRGEGESVPAAVVPVLQLQLDSETLTLLLLSKHVSDV